MADDAIDEASLKVSNTPTDGYVLTAESGNTGGLTWAATSTTGIADSSVTYTKIQDVSATNRILGRDSAGAGVIEEITPANLLTMLGVETGATADQSASEIKTLLENGIDSVHYVDGSIDLAHMSADSVDSTQYVDGSIDTAHYAAGSVDATALGADAVTAAKIGDNVIDSEHYAAGSIDNEHLAADSVDGTKIADDAIDSEHIAADSIDAEHYAAGSVDTTALGADAVTGAKIADDAIDSEHIAADSIDAEHYAAGSVDATALGADCVTAAKIGDNVIDSEHYAAASIDNEHLADDAVGVAELSATGTASSATFLRGDNSWGTPIGGVTSVNSVTGAVTAANIATAVEAASDSNTFTDADHTKLGGIASSANNYSHPTYDGDDIDVDTTALTGATVVSDIDINVTTDTSGHVTDANGSISTRTLTLANLGYTGTTDANTYSHPTSAGNKHIPSGGSSGQFLKYDSSGTAVWAADNDTNTTYSVQDGELSEINFTSADNTKLDSIASSANNYSHPSYNGDDFSIDTGHLSGATVIDDIDINVTTDSSGHVTDANGTVATRNLTLSDLGYSGATNANYITNNNQLSNGAGYVTSSGNTVIGTDSDVDTSGSTIIDNIYMTDGVITSHGTRTLTLGNLGFTGASNANYITNNNQLSNGAGYNNYSFPYSTNANQGFNKVVRWQYGGGGSTSNDDHNVSTFDDHDTGYWSANFSPAMSDDDYACAGSVMSDSQYNVAFFSQSTSKIYFIVRHNTSNAMTDKTTGAIIVGD